MNSVEKLAERPPSNPADSRRILFGFLVKNSQTNIEDIFSFAAKKHLFFGQRMNSFDYLLALRDIGLIKLELTTGKIKLTEDFKERLEQQRDFKTIVLITPAK